MMLSTKVFVPNLMTCFPIDQIESFFVKTKPYGSMVFFTSYKVKEELTLVGVFLEGTTLTS
jgi:hypothetical protein